MERLRERRSNEEMRTQEEEDRSEIVALGIENLIIETAGIKEEAAQHL